MSIFKKEADMQHWIEDQLDSYSDLADLISNPNTLDAYLSSSLEEERVLESFKTTYKSLHTNEVICADKNISLDNPDRLRPDIILYAAESQGIVIVELKNFSKPTREAGTELSAYAAEIKTYIPFLSDGDLFNVIISEEWPTLLRHCIFHEIFWQQKNYICLEPIDDSGNIQLKILDIKKLLEANTATKISDRHIAGYQICLYDDNLYKEPTNRTRLDNHIEQMKAALYAMSVEGNKQNSHGFAFLWKDQWSLSLAPYSISIFNMAPFESLERYLHDIDHESDLNEFQKKLFKLLVEQDPTGHGDSLWKITETGCAFLNSFSSPRCEGFSTWGALKDSLEDRATLIAFHGWGVFGDLFKKRLIKEYENGQLTTSVTCPNLGLQVITDLIDENYDFIDYRHLDLTEADEEDFGIYDSLDT